MLMFANQIRLLPLSHSLKRVGCWRRSSGTADNQTECSTSSTIPSDEQQRWSKSLMDENEIKTVCTVLSNSLLLFRRKFVSFSTSETNFFGKVKEGKFSKSKDIKLLCS